MVYESKNYLYTSAFGQFQVQAEIEISDREYELVKKGAREDSLPHKVVNEKKCLRQAASLFYRANYQLIARGSLSLEVGQVEAIRKILGLNITQFSQCLGIKKGSASNILNGKRVMKTSTQILLMDKLGLELYKPGTAMNVLNHTLVAPLDEETRLMVSTLSAL